MVWSVSRAPDCCERRSTGDSVAFTTPLRHTTFVVTALPHCDRLRASNALQSW